MLNIPDEVKALFQSDSIFKNFHVHFPNGEHTDLNNENITAESVEFTESLCSQESFRFGLTEASELKFTCVNVPNIRGVTLEAAIEIDVATLGAAWISAHQPSGAEAFLDPQVCTYDGRDLYRVPYGVFIVDTCPRNHETMYKRDVTAYTERLTDTLASPGQISVMNAFYPELDTYSPRTKALFWAAVSNSHPEALAAGGYEAASLTSSGSDEMGYTLYVKDSNGVAIELNATVANSYFVPAGTAHPQTDIYSIEWGNFWTRDYVQELADRIETATDVDISVSGYSSYYELATDLLKGFHLPKMRVQYNNNTAYESIMRGANVIYPHVTEGDTVAAAVPSVIHLWYTKGSQSSQKANIGIPAVTFSLYQDTTASTDPMAWLSVSVNSTLKTTGKLPGQSGKTMYSFANAFSLSGLVSGYLELLCMFGSPARTGGIEITGLDNSTPVSILPGNYSELWYDETTISPIGYALVKFKGSDGNEQDITVQIGTGSSVYDLTENEVLQNTVFTVTDAEAGQGITIESKIIDFLNAVFTPNIPDMSFVPIELTKQGLPYLEAGDAIEITTGDAQTVPSFILRQTISGIQFLTADVESANGEAIEVLT